MEDSLDPRRRSCWLGSGVVLEAAADDIRRLHQGWTDGRDYTLQYLRYVLYIRGTRQGR